MGMLNPKGYTLKELHNTQKDTLKEFQIGIDSYICLACIAKKKTTKDRKINNAKNKAKNLNSACFDFYTNSFLILLNLN